MFNHCDRVRAKIKSYDSFSHAEDSLGEFYAKNLLASAPEPLSVKIEADMSKDSSIPMDVDLIDKSTLSVKEEPTSTLSIEIVDPIDDYTPPVKPDLDPIDDSSPDSHMESIDVEPAVLVKDEPIPPKPVLKDVTPAVTIRGQLGASPYFQNGIEEREIKMLSKAKCFKCDAIVFPGDWENVEMIWEYPGIVTESSTSEWLVKKPTENEITECVVPVDAAVYSKDGLAYTRIECEGCREVCEGV
jgi:hypothetical protein